MKTITMKKNVFKLAVAALVFFLGVNVVNAQEVEDNNYVVATDVITHHTVGRTLGFYVEPDAVYNPNYTAGGEWVLNPSSGWTWSFSDNDATLAPADNFVEISGLTVGNWLISVFETNENIACDGDEVTETVVILPEPTMVVNEDGIEFGVQCGNLEDHTISFSLTAATLADDRISAQWRLKQFPITIDGGTGDPIEGDQDGEDVVFLWDKFDESPQIIGGEEWTMEETTAFVGDGNTAPALAEYTLSMTRDYNLPGGEVAYLYRWVIELVEDDGINDRISRKSDYIDNGLAVSPDNFTVYGTAGTIDIYVVRAPETGPIYHIPNSFGN